MKTLKGMEWLYASAIVLCSIACVVNLFVFIQTPNIKTLTISMSMLALAMSNGAFLLTSKARRLG